MDRPTQNNLPEELDSHSFIRLIEIVFWLAVVSIPGLAWFIPLPPPKFQWLLAITLLAGLYLWAFFRQLLPRFRVQSWVIYIGLAGAITLIAGYDYLLRPEGIYMGVILVTIIASLGIIAGRRISLWAAFLSVLAETLVTAVHGNLTYYQLPVFALRAVLLLIAGYVVSFLTGGLHEKVLQADRRNRYLSTLLQAGLLASSSERISPDLHNTLTQIAELITRHIPATVCRIFLLSPQGDLLIAYGAFPQRPLPGWKPGGSSMPPNVPIRVSPSLRDWLKSNPYALLHKDALEQPVSYALSRAEIEQLGLGEVQTICLVPLAFKGESLGLIAIGEARRWEREPFAADKLALLQTLATQVSAAIYNARLFREAQGQAERLAVLNEVAKAIGSTIELDDLLELIYEQLSRVIPSDTYFVSLFDVEANELDFRVLIDDNQRFPSQRLPLGQGFSSWVILNRQPLLVRHLSQEVDTLPVRPVSLGQERISESWLGMPILAGDQALGLLAIASYTPYAFDEDDLTLLGNLTAQAALALDNARQHAAVKEQARRDSLTGVYNHGYLLLRLDEEIERCQESHLPVSLIMLDIDYFKSYNDKHGHVVGDEVLRRLVGAIQTHIKKTDIIGRWGGEEFAMVLPGATTQQAKAVAERVRTSLAEMDLRDQHNQRIPSPTVSQGIATLPAHAHNAAQLVDIADRALYRAKEMGRDQVMAAGEGVF